MDIEELLNNSKFIKYLEKQFMQTDYGKMCLDDDLPDAFEYWLENLTDDQIHEYAEQINLLTK